MASLILMLLLSFSLEDFKATPLMGKINVILLVPLLFLGACYKNVILFDKETEQITLGRGLLFLYKTRRFSFDELSALMVKRIAIPRRALFNLDFQKQAGPEVAGSPEAGGPEAGGRYTVGFVLRGKTTVLDRRLNRRNMEYYCRAFLAFFPRSVEVIE